MTNRGRGRPKKSDNTFDYKTRMGWYRREGWKALSDELIAAKQCGRCSVPSTRYEAHHHLDPFPTRDRALVLDRANIVVLCAACHRVAHHTRPRAVTPCETCGDHVVHVLSRKVRFCSIACRDKHPDFAARPERVCLECSATFKPSQETVVRCSTACSAKHVARLKLAKRPTFECGACGKAFTVPPSQAARPIQGTRCCSRACGATLRTRPSVA